MPNCSTFCVVPSVKTGKKANQKINLTSKIHTFKNNKANFLYLAFAKRNSHYRQFFNFHISITFFY
ncbi:MAG: hypothetical protein CL599_10715 [Alteromonas sp.]|nr:hypothetical protein [Alteromonas sp.]OUX86801.1 MAG: hypothetical protein CBB95_10335 [Alteromonas sp. TMED35]